MNQSSAIDFLHQLRMSQTQENGTEYRLYQLLSDVQTLRTPPEGAKPVSLKTLNNRINHIHFTEGALQGVLRQRDTGETFAIKARPKPCAGEDLSCTWSDRAVTAFHPQDYELLALVIDDGHAQVLAPAEFVHVDSEGFAARLPEFGYQIDRRRTERYPCRGISAELIQGGLSAKGELVDFTPFGFRIRIKTEPVAIMRWFDVASPAALRLSRDGSLVFSSQCMYIHHNGEHEPVEIVLAPAAGRAPGEDNEERNPLQRLVPSPSLVIQHPLLGNAHRFKATQVSTSALVIEEDVSEAVLIPGLRIRDAAIEFAGGLKVNCTVQVDRRDETDDDTFSCRMDIMDMDIRAYERLARILISALDPMADQETEMDAEALWEFLFDTGFIYPKKYGLIHAHAQEIKATGRKVYGANPEIAAHFTSKKGRRIQAHISMIRAYERTWMIHHHASRGTDMRHSGFSVLKQLMFYLNDMHRLPSSATDYVMMFFRPENRFPARIYGDFASLLDNQGSCSMDPMAYLPYTALSLDIDLPDGWTLAHAKGKDLEELKRSYDAGSGGLLLKAMNLDDTSSCDGSLNAVYEKAGLTRERTAYALSYRGEARAVLVADRSDLGLNLSELLNGIKVLVIDREDLPWRVLSTAISKLARTYPMNRVPVLFHPVSYVERHNVPFEKQYNAWILDVRHGDEFMRYMRKNFRIRYRAALPQ